MVYQCSKFQRRWWNLCRCVMSYNTIKCHISIPLKLGAKYIIKLKIYNWKSNFKIYIILIKNNDHIYYLYYDRIICFIFLFFPSPSIDPFATTNRSWKYRTHLADVLYRKWKDDFWVALRVQLSSCFSWR